MRKLLISFLLTLFSSPVFAICNPPYQVVFSCDLWENERQIELCATQWETNEYSIKESTFNFAQKNRLSDLFFHRDGAFSASLKHYESDTNNTFFGIGFLEGGRYYTFFATGSYQTGEMNRGFVEVFDSKEAFLDESTGKQSEHWECKNRTLQGNYNFFAP